MLWKIAIMEQLNALIANSTWELVKRPSKDSNIIISKWVFKVKYTVSGLIDRYKARLVARGFTQVYRIDFEETFVPTLRLESLRMLMAFAVYFGFEIEQMDVPDAYLKANLTETIYMEIPQGYEIPHNQKHEDLILHLLRPLYGLKQSGREWNTKAKKRIGSFMYAMVGTRPDIAFAVCKLSQYCQDPSLRHRIAFDRVLRYLKGTIDLALVYDHSQARHPVCYAHAAYGDDVVNRKSTYGHTLLIGNASVTWASKKQRTTASSTTEVNMLLYARQAKTLYGPRVGLKN